MLVLVLPLYAQLGLERAFDYANLGGAVGGIDFRVYYLTSELFLKGQNFYDPSLQIQAMRQHQLPVDDTIYLYPPLFPLLFLPFTYWPIEQAARVWYFVNLGLYLSALIVSLSALRFELRDPLTPCLMILGLLFVPALFNLYKGQVNALLLLLLVVAYVALLRGRPLATGVGVALAAWIKGVPALLFLLFLRKSHWKIIAAGIVATFGITFLLLLLMGPPPFQGFFDQALPSLAHPEPNPSNLSLRGFLSLLLTENAYADPLLVSPTLWSMASVLLSAALSASLFLASRRTADERTQSIEVGLAISLMPLVAPIGWLDLYTLAVFPLLVLVREWKEGRLGALRGVLALSSFLMLSNPRVVDLLTQLGLVLPLRHPLLIGLPLFGGLVIWALLVSLVLESRSAHPD
ncbi:MAG: DUF2029 domain-containing protein [Chloroflexi bacterium]|nr:DUF2029 domain-containing protein [Chloroflexota bacterium]